MVSTMTLDSHQTFEIGKLLLLEYKDGNFHINQHRELIYLNERFESSQGQKRKKKKGRLLKRAKWLEKQIHRFEANNWVINMLIMFFLNDILYEINEYKDAHSCGSNWTNFMKIYHRHKVEEFKEKSSLAQEWAMFDIQGWNKLNL